MRSPHPFTAFAATCTGRSRVDDENGTRSRELKRNGSERVQAMLMVEEKEEDEEEGRVPELAVAVVPSARARAAT